MTAPLPLAILPLLQAQHACFGHQMPQDPSCGSCLVQALCLQQKERLLADFSLEWERFQHFGAVSEYLPLSSPAPCSHCHMIMRPEEGKVLHVLGKGTYHARCVELAFPNLPQ